MLAVKPRLYARFILRRFPLLPEVINGKIIASENLSGGEKYDTIVFDQLAVSWPFMY